MRYNMYIAIYKTYNIDNMLCILVCRDRVRRLASDQVIKRSSPATGIIRYA